VIAKEVSARKGPASFSGLVSYLLERESGVAWRACGWRPVAETPGRSWDSPGRPRPVQLRMWLEHEDVTKEDKVRWELVL